MKKISLSPEQENVLSRFVTENVTEAPLIKGIIKHYMRELDSVQNIDPKGNMGLQALAAQRSVEILKEVFDIIFPEQVDQKKREPGKMSQWR